MRVYESGLPLATCFTVPVCDWKVVSLQTYADRARFLSRQSSPHLAIIYRWELILVWEYLRQVLINREQLWVAMQKSQTFDRAAYSRAFRWQVAVSSNGHRLSCRLDSSSCC